jgi:hypothetical protein
MSAAELAKTEIKTASKSLAETIDAAFDRRDEIGPATKGAVREAVEDALDLLDRGAARVAERAANGAWQVNQMAQEGGTAVVSIERHGHHPGRARPCGLVGQGAI